jgi:hypothetical protein
LSLSTPHIVFSEITDIKLVWNSNGLETKTSKQEKLTGTILRCNENLIVSRILKILLNEKELIDWE